MNKIQISKLSAFLGGCFPAYHFGGWWAIVAFWSITSLMDRWFSKPEDMVLTS